MAVCTSCGNTFAGAGSVCPACSAQRKSIPAPAPMAGVAAQGTHPSPPAPQALIELAMTTGETPGLEAYLSADTVETPKSQTPVPGGPDPLIGTRPIGQYQIVRKIGAGGFGAVYLAEQIGVDRKAVIKVLHKRGDDPEIFVKRFEREAAVLARLDNPHLVRLYNFGKLDDGQLFVAMEYGGDATLASVMDNGRLEPDRALLIAEQICEALEEAHQHGIVHRDLKPHNILLGRKGTQEWVKVVDVGLAKILGAADISQPAAALTLSGVLVGTPAYFSPEQARGLSVDARSDLYAVGVVLYQMLTGSFPVVGVTPLDFVRAHASEPPTPMRQLGIDLPAWLESVVMKALEKDPARRYQSAEEMRTALRQARERLFAVRKPRSFRRALVPGAVAVVLAGMAVAVYTLRKPSPPLAEKSPPETPSGTLQLSGAPAGARVLLDGAPFDASRPVAAGRHHLHLEAEGFKALDRDVTVAHGATVKVALAMQKRPGRPPPARPEKLAAPVADAAPTETRIPESQPEAEAAAARLMAEAKALESEGQFIPAIAKLEQALAQGPTGPARGRILGKLGVLNQLTGAIPAAIKYFQLYRPYCAPDKLAELDGLIRRLQASEGMAPR